MQKNTSKRAGKKWKPPKGWVLVAEAAKLLNLTRAAIHARARKAMAEKSPEYRRMGDSDHHPFIVSRSEVNRLANALSGKV